MVKNTKKIRAKVVVIAENGKETVYSVKTTARNLKEKRNSTHSKVKAHNSAKPYVKRSAGNCKARSAGKCKASKRSVGRRGTGPGSRKK